MAESALARVQFRWKAIAITVLLVLVVCPVVFILCAYGTGILYLRWALAHYKGSHDGQLGLAAMGYGSMGGLLGSFVALALILFARRKKVVEVPPDITFRSQAPGTQQLNLH